MNYISIYIPNRFDNFANLYSYALLIYLKKKPKKNPTTYCLKKRLNINAIQYTIIINSLIACLQEY